MICAATTMTCQNTSGSSLELILSTIAIVISLLAIAFEFFGNQRINRINLEAKFYEDIFDDFLVDKLPNARNKLVYNNNIISGADTLIDVLNELRRKSIFFKYRDVKFYDELVELLHNFEDELVRKSDKHLDSDEYCKFTEYVKSTMEKIYFVIITKYTGKICIKRHKK